MKPFSKKCPLNVHQLVANFVCSDAGQEEIHVLFTNSVVFKVSVEFIMSTFFNTSIRLSDQRVERKVGTGEEN